MFCPKCGQELPDGSAFCTKCGAKLESRTAIDDAIAAPETETSTAATSTASVTPTPNYTGAARKKSKGPVVIGAVAAAAVLVIAAVVYAVFFSPYNIDSTTFPDDTLRRTISRSCDSDRDGKLSRSEAAEVTKLDFSDTEIEDLKGIELLPNLKSLNLSNCAYVESIDVTKNGALEELVLSNTGVSQLDVARNAHLTNLNIVGCAIESLDLSHNREMKTLNAAGSALDSLNVSGCANLKSLNVRSTDLTELDVSGAKSLEALLVDDTVDVTGVENTGVREQWVLVSANKTGVSDVAYPGMQQIYNLTKDMTFTYNASNQLTGYSNSYYYDSASYGTYSENVAFEYDGDRVTSISKSTTSTSSRGGTSYGSYTYGFNYNEDGLLSSYYSRYKSNSSTYYYYGYDENGQQTSSDNYRYVYDDAGRLISVIYKSGGSVSLSISYDDSNRVSRIDYATSGVYRTFEYDDAGRCVAAHYESTSAEYGYDTEYAYDAAGNMTMMRIVKSDGSIVGSASYEYDNHGNVVKKVISNPSMDSKYQTGVTTYSYRRVYTRSDDPDIPTALPYIVGGNSEIIGIPFNQAFAGDDLSKQIRGSYQFVGERPYLS